MTYRLRVATFLGAGMVLLGILLSAIVSLPPYGACSAILGAAANAITVSSRHITNAPTAVNFDFRAIDTMGEEYILFGSVVGTLVLLRHMRREEEAESAASGSDPGIERISRPSDAVQLLGATLIVLLMVFGIYIITHAHLTPGGGFQGGAIVGTASPLIYLAAGYAIYDRLSPSHIMELCHASGAGIYVAIGLAGLIFGGFFLDNALPLGATRTFLSGGMIPLINDAVGLEVSFGFAIVFHEFIAQSRRHSQ